MRPDSRANRALASRSRGGRHAHPSLSTEGSAVLSSWRQWPTRSRRVSSATGLACALVLSSAGIRAGETPSKVPVASAPTVLPGCISAPPRSLSLMLSIVSPVAESMRDEIRHEITSIWRSHGVLLDWVNAPRIASDRPVLRLVVQDDLQGLGARPDPTTIAWIRFMEARPLTLIRLSTRSALRYVSRSARRRSSGELHLVRLVESDFYRAVFVRLLGWSLAHEVGHYLLESRKHAQTGLMRSAFPTSELAAPRADSVALPHWEVRALDGRARPCSTE